MATIGVIMTMELTNMNVKVALTGVGVITAGLMVISTVNGGMKMMVLLMYPTTVTVVIVLLASTILTIGVVNVGMVLVMILEVVMNVMITQTTTIWSVILQNIIIIFTMEVTITMNLTLTIPIAIIGVLMMMELITMSVKVELIGDRAIMEVDTEIFTALGGMKMMVPLMYLITATVEHVLLASMILMIGVVNVGMEHLQVPMNVLIIQTTIITNVPIAIIIIIFTMEVIITMKLTTIM